MIELKQLRVQYLTDQAGETVAVLLPVEQFNELIEDIEDLAAVAERREEPSVSHQALLAELKRDWFTTS